ncbi:hypothetical protein JW992_06690 [candidate division KSB1 bacterium]|nr:hypothetical protein [candidate division KSB1 bacterium]
MKTLYSRYTLFLLLLFVVISGCRSYGPVPPVQITAQQSAQPIKFRDHDDQVIYLIMIDRFADGDPTNNSGNNSDSHILFDPESTDARALKTYQGGDLRGIIDKLDYLAGFGVTTLWLTPVMDNSDRDYRGWWPYHGYHPIDHYRIEEHFGDIGDLRELIAGAHSRGMHILLDMVLNHVAYDHPWVVDSELWENQGYKHWFHPHSLTDESTMITNWEDPKELERKEIARLPDLAQENPHVADFLIDMSKEWIERTGCDGFRLDAVRHVPKSFWRRYTREIHDFAGPGFFLVGEVFSGDMDYLAEYGDLGFDALFDFSLHYGLIETVATGGSPQRLRDILTKAEETFSHRTCLLVPFVDNHDVERLISNCTEPLRPRIESALVLLFAQPGIPSLYYGTELMLPGATPQDTVEGDFLNRRNMPWHLLGNDQRDLRSLIRTLADWRKSPALRRGKRHDLIVDDAVYAFSRSDAAESFIIAVNTANRTTLRKIELQGIPDDTPIADCFTADTSRVEQGTLTLTIPANGWRMLHLEKVHTSGGKKAWQEG